MAVLNIRNLPDDLHARLRIRAAKAGRSMEAEVQATITAVCTTDGVPQYSSDLQGAWVDSLYSRRYSIGDVPHSLTDHCRRQLFPVQFFRAATWT